MLRILNRELKKILNKSIFKDYGINRLGNINRDKLFYSKLSNSFCLGKEKQEVKENCEKNESDNTKHLHESKENIEEKQTHLDSKQEESEKKSNQSEDVKETPKEEKINPKRDFMASLRKLLFGSGVASNATKTKTKKER